MSAEAAALVAEADRAFAARDLDRAWRLLGRANALAPKDLAIHLRRAGIAHAMGRWQAALLATEDALALSPLDFTALAIRAGLLERLEDAGAGEAWGHALAQRPPGPLPDHIAAALVRGEACHSAWLEARDASLAEAAHRAMAGAGEDIRARIARFRSNALRRTRPFHSEPTHYHYPGLAEREFHPRARFPWLAEVEAATDMIAAELETVMAAQHAELVPYIRYGARAPLGQWRTLNHSRDWTAIHLVRNASLVDRNACHCPRTLALIRDLWRPEIAGASPNAMFSLLAPGTTIPPHTGISNARLVCHLPLIVPEGCWFRVGAETRQWRRGEAFVFDDTIEHEAANPSEGLRIVLIFDLWHPDLDAIEREAVAAMIARDGVATTL